MAIQVIHTVRVPLQPMRKDGKMKRIHAVLQSPRHACGRTIRIETPKGKEVPWDRYAAPMRGYIYGQVMESLRRSLTVMEQVYPNNRRPSILFKPYFEGFAKGGGADGG